MMRTAVLLLTVLCTGCGAETAGTAAAGAAIKKQELDAGKQTMQRAEQKIGESLEAQQQRASSAADAADK